MRELYKTNITIILLGNKADLEEKKEVKPNEGWLLAQKNDYQFFETLCLKNGNIVSAFEALNENTNA